MEAVELRGSTVLKGHFGDFGQSIGSFLLKRQDFTTKKNRGGEIETGASGLRNKIDRIKQHGLKPNLHAISCICDNIA